jgi:peptidoglycan/LPS O-acetylase OafA/YrhL
VLTLVFHVDQAYLYAAFDTRLDSLMVGCLLAVLLKRGVVSDRWHAVWGTPLAFVTTAAAFVASARLSQIYGTQYRDVIGFAIDPPLVAAMIVQAIALSSTVYARWLDWRVLRFLGTISYSLYLWQQWTLSIARRLDGFPLPVHFAGAMLLTLAAGSFSYYVVERPFLKLKRPKRAVPAAGPFEQPASAPLPVPPVTP